MSISSEGLTAKQISPEEQDAMQRAFNEAFSEENILALELALDALRQKAEQP